MRVWIAQLIHNRIEETNPSFVVQFLRNLLEKLVVAVIFILSTAVFQILLSHVEHHCVNHTGIGHRLISNLLAGVHHLLTDFLDNSGLSRFEVVLKIILKALLRQAGLIIGEDPWLFHFAMNIEAQVFSEWVWSLDVSRHCSQDHILELNAVIWQIIHQVKVEITKEVWVVL